MTVEEAQAQAIAAFRALPEALHGRLLAETVITILGPLTADDLLTFYYETEGEGEDPTAMRLVDANPTIMTLFGQFLHVAFLLSQLDPEG
jgi:hypothetical protein